jgi:hypothetical protein
MLMHTFFMIVFLFCTMLLFYHFYEHDIYIYIYIYICIGSKSRVCFNTYVASVFLKYVISLTKNWAKLYGIFMLPDRK